MLAKPRNGWTALETTVEGKPVTIGPISYLSDAPVMLAEAFWARFIEEEPLNVTFESESEGYVDLVEIDDCIFAMKHFDQKDPDIHGTLIGFSDMIPDLASELIVDITENIDGWALFEELGSADLDEIGERSAESEQERRRIALDDWCTELSDVLTKFKIVDSKFNHDVRRRARC
jgi:hypothetical protein